MNEIGVRLAFGAEPSSIFKMIVGQGMTLSALGVAAGLFGVVPAHAHDVQPARGRKSDGRDDVRSDGGRVPRDRDHGFMAACAARGQRAAERGPERELTTTRTNGSNLRQSVVLFHLQVLESGMTEDGGLNIVSVAHGIAQPPGEIGHDAVHRMHLAQQT